MNEVMMNRHAWINELLHDLRSYAESNDLIDLVPHIDAMMETMAAQPTRPTFAKTDDEAMTPSLRDGPA